MDPAAVSAFSDLAGIPANAATAAHLPPRGAGQTAEPANAGDPVTPSVPGSAQSSTDTNTGAAGSEADGAVPGQAGDDPILAQFESLSLLPPAATPGAQGTDTVLPETPEAIEKSINPDGKATVEDRLRNAQSLIGRQGAEVGKWRKATAEFAKHIQYDDAGKPVINLGTIAADLGPERLNAQMAHVGLKLVPLEAKVAGDTFEANESEIVNALVPDKELSLEDKQNLINADPVLSKKYNRELVRQEMEHRTKVESQKIRMQQEFAAEKGRCDSFLGELAKLPHFEKELHPAMQAYNRVIPTNKPLTGLARVKVLRMLGEVERFPAVIKLIRDQAYKAAEKSILDRMGAGMPSGENPTYVPPGRTASAGLSAAEREALAKAVL